MLELPQYFLPGMILLASFAGSAHCVGMCGPLIWSTTKSKLDIVQYQLGRLLAYLFLGMLAGLLGSVIWKYLPNSQQESLSSWSKIITLAASLGLAFMLLFSGLSLFRGKHFAVPIGFPSLHRTFQKITHRLPTTRSGLAGFLSAFLPCGWLHLALLGAISCGSIKLGMLYMLFFWAGAVPALSGLPFLGKAVIQKFRYGKKVFGTLMMISGLFLITYKMIPIVSEQSKLGQELSEHSCH